MSEARSRGACGKEHHVVDRLWDSGRIVGSGFYHHLSVRRFYTHFTGGRLDGLGDSGYSEPSRGLTQASTDQV